MQLTDIHTLLDTLQLPSSALVETHISWVILTAEYAYKIKRPVRFSFLDFSTLALRHHSCLREIELNRRLTRDMYLGIKPVCKKGKEVSFEEGEIIDYAIEMRRLPDAQQMDRMLQRGDVTAKHMEQIAQTLASFHQSTDKASEAPDVKVMQRDFEDIEQHIPFLREKIGEEAQQTIRQAIASSRDFLNAHELRIQERYQLGFVVDGHGDLHSKNIFLLDEPVIFDCIEFNDHFRYVDVLDELAFFCNDLMVYEREDLMKYFLQTYFALHRCMITKEDELLFRYYQLYRSGVKMKINVIKAGNAKNENEREYRLGRVKEYFSLFKSFCQNSEDR